MEERSTASVLLHFFLLSKPVSSVTWTMLLNSLPIWDEPGSFRPHQQQLFFFFFLDFNLITVVFVPSPPTPKTLPCTLLSPSNSWPLFALIVIACVHIVMDVPKYTSLSQSHFCIKLRGSNLLQVSLFTSWKLNWWRLVLWHLSLDFSAEWAPLLANFLNTHSLSFSSSI